MLLLVNGGPMPILQIRDLPKPLYEKLKDLALQERRSLSQQAIVTLEKGLTAGSRVERQYVLAELRKAESLRFPKGLTSPATLIREDRDR